MMMKAAVILFIAVHGLIHLFGYAKAFELADIRQLKRPVSKFHGLLWLIGAILFISAAVLLVNRVEWWWLPLCVGMFLSQYLIFTSWQDAKFGTIANGIIFLIAIVAYSGWQFHHSYQTQVADLVVTAANPGPVLTEVDIEDLPDPVRRYLHYTGVVGRPRVKEFSADFSGEIRASAASPWMAFTSEQHNSVDASTRLFFMKATMKQLPVSGFHSFRNGQAFMDIRLLSLFKVQYQSGKEMSIAETVTFFNDMCVMAPATLVDQRIKWLAAEGDSVKAEFHNNGTSITAWLYFNDKGELINFVSDDRYAAVDGRMIKLRWSTPLRAYRDFGGVRLASHAEAVYAYPDGDLTYGTFRLRAVRYNNSPPGRGPAKKVLTCARY